MAKEKNDIRPLIDLLKKQEVEKSKEAAVKIREKASFKCPLCGHDKYTEVWRNNGIYGPGGQIWVDHCICQGCTNVFIDPERFSQCLTVKAPAE